MVKKVFVSAAIALAAAACQTQQNQPQPDVWSANYNVPFDVMVACLAAPPTGAFQVYAPAYPEAGMARIVFIPANTPQAQVGVRRAADGRQRQHGELEALRQHPRAGLARRRGPQAGRRLRRHVSLPDRGSGRS